MEDMKIRRYLHIQDRGKKTYLPPAAYWFSKEEKKRFCKRLSKFRGPDGYCGNISNCVSLEPPEISGMKSHDHHVLMQNLLPVALRGLLPKGPRFAVTRLCNYFNRLCQRVIDPEKLISLEYEFVETMCQMERFFPPSLFDIMFHLPVHLGREARLGGPVHFRWMYPFERYMKTLKAYVKNYARPEACMAEGYLAEECLAFCLEFLKNTLPIEEALNRNEDVSFVEDILEGRPLHKPQLVTLSEKERDIAHLWRPTLAVCSIGEAIGTKIPWPVDRVVFESPDCSFSGVKPAGSTDTSESQTTCNIYAWNGSDIVAEGKICSVDPSEKVSGIMLGPNAAIIKIEKVIDEKAFLWRPSPEMAEMGNAKYMSIAWPLDKISFISRLVDSPKTSPVVTSKSTGSSKSANKKCILYDCIGSGKIVAEGRVLSTNPADLVHFVPIGPNASKVLVDLSKIGDAKVWRPNSEIECIGDATGSVLAWPNDKLKLV